MTGPGDAERDVIASGPDATSTGRVGRSLGALTGSPAGPPGGSPDSAIGG
jgi:hypothetical protein